MTNTQRDNKQWMKDDFDIESNDQKPRRFSLFVAETETWTKILNRNKKNKNHQYYLIHHNNHNEGACYKNTNLSLPPSANDGYTKTSRQQRKKQRETQITVNASVWFLVHRQLSLHLLIMLGERDLDANIGRIRRFRHIRIIFRLQLLWIDNDQTMTVFIFFLVIRRKFDG